MAQWYYVQNNTRSGPVDTARLVELVVSGELQSMDLVWQTGMNEWMPVANVAELAVHLPPPIPASAPPAMPHFAASPGAQQSVVPHQVSNDLIHPSPTGKDPLLAAILSGCCIAGFGQIYLGQMGKGLVILLSQIVLAVITGGAALPVCWVIGGVDAYQIGKKLKNGYSVRKWEWF